MTLWVFGYGSLLWDPGFEPAETRKAQLQGYHRSFCMLSIHYRGTEEQPGLVLALDEDEGAVCDGVAFRVKPEEETPVLNALRKRELISDAYLEAMVDVVDEGGDALNAVTYVINRDNRQYCGHALKEQAKRIISATGVRGPNRDYLFNTVAKMRALGIHDPDLEWLFDRVQALAAKTD